MSTGGEHATEFTRLMEPTSPKKLNDLMDKMLEWDRNRDGDISKQE